MNKFMSNYNSIFFYGWLSQTVIYGYEWYSFFCYSFLGLAWLLMVSLLQICGFFVELYY